MRGMNFIRRIRNPRTNGIIEHEDIIFNAFMARAFEAYIFKFRIFTDRVRVPDYDYVLKSVNLIVWFI